MARLARTPALQDVPASYLPLLFHEAARPESIIELARKL
jgi:hypothetical protein